MKKLLIVDGVYYETLSEQEILRELGDEVVHVTRWKTEDTEVTSILTVWSESEFSEAV